MDAETLKWVMSQGVGAVLAFVMFMVYRKDVHEALNSWREQTKILTGLVQEATVALTRHSDAVETCSEAVAAMERKLPHACPMAAQMADEAVASAIRRVR
jgi:hypothetical protein